MNGVVVFSVPGEPVAKGRPRFSRSGASSGASSRLCRLGISIRVVPSSCSAPLKPLSLFSKSSIYIVCLS